MFLYYIYKFVTYNKLKNHDSLIINTLCSNRGINHNKIERLHNYPNIIEYLDNRYTDSSSIEETIKRIKLNIEEKPKCPYCGAPVIFIGKKTKMFTKYCSNSCRSKDISKYIWQEGQKKYNLEHYGKECNFQIDKCKEKRVNTLIEKYGTSIIYEIPEFSRQSKGIPIVNLLSLDKNENIQPAKTSNPRRRIDGFAAMLNAYVCLIDSKTEYMNLIR